MFPEYAGPCLLQSNLAPNGSSRAVKFHCSLNVSRVCGPTFVTVKLGSRRVAAAAGQLSFIVAQMFPEYAGPRLLQSNLAPNGSSRAVEFHCRKRGPHLPNRPRR